jgi:hypothetical protein
MGNWRRVHIVGGMLAEEVEALKAEINQVLPARFSTDLNHTPEFKSQQNKFGPLSYTGGLCGLGNWPAPSINAVGNLAERDYDCFAIADHLRKLSKVAPSLGVRVHCGGDYESDTCVATVVLFEGVAVIRVAEIKGVPDMDPLEMQNNLLRAVLGPYNRTL